MTASNTIAASVAVQAIITGWSEKDYANRGACAKAARAALGTDTVRGTDFELRCREDGRWQWTALELPAESTGRATDTLTAEEWLTELATRLNESVFFPVLETDTSPAFRISRSFPGGGSARKRIGECWSSKASNEELIEMFVSPRLQDSMEIACVTAHEMVHMHVGTEHGHKAPFARVAKAIGMIGKMTESKFNDGFKAQVQVILDDMPAYPAKAVNLAGRKVQKTYLKKVTCTHEDCEDMVLRMTQKVVDACVEGPMGGVVCPCCGLTDGVIIE